MIREVEQEDATQIAAIYNEYVLHGTATFDVQPVTPEEMLERIKQIADEFPYLVYEQDGRVMGYCYAHTWKEKAAYHLTLETTIYVDAACIGRGLGRQLMQALINECRKRGYHALIACITQGNEASDNLHTALGFKQVSCFEQVGQKFGRWLDVTDYELIL